jgi:hypothetical protein
MRSNGDKNQKKHLKTVVYVFQHYLGDELKWAQTQTVRSLFENDPHRSRSFFSSALGIGLDFGSDLLRFLLIGLLQAAGDTMVFVWAGLLLGLVARIFVSSDLIKKLEVRGAS